MLGRRYARVALKTIQCIAGFCLTSALLLSVLDVRITIKVLYLFPLGYKINITNIASTTPLHRQLLCGVGKIRASRGKKRGNFFTFGLYAINDLTSIRFGSACMLKVEWIKRSSGSQMMWEWVSVCERERPNVDFHYHKPYACSLWSGCKVNKAGDKQHCTYYQYRLLAPLVSHQNNTGCQTN